MLDLFFRMHIILGTIQLHKYIGWLHDLPQKKKRDNYFENRQLIIKSIIHIQTLSQF